MRPRVRVLSSPPTTTGAPLSPEQQLMFDTVRTRFLKGQPAHASELAEELDWERARAQRVLDELVSLGCLAKVRS